MRIASPMKFRNNQILLADDPDASVLKTDFLTPFEFGSTVVRGFSNDAINFYECFIMNHVERLFVGDSSRNRAGINIVIALEKSENLVNVFGRQFNYEVNAAGHPRLTIVIHRQ